MKKKLLIIGVIVVGVVVLLGVGGTVQTSYEYVDQNIEQEFVGYINDKVYTDEIVITAEDLPEWVNQFTLDTAIAKDEEFVIPLEPGAEARLALYSDFQYVEQLNETRRALSGSLVEQYSEFYYKPTGTTYLLPVYEGQEVGMTFDHNQVKYKN